MRYDDKQTCSSQAPDNVDIEKIKPIKRGFNKWWYEIGSGINPNGYSDIETAIEIICKMAWEASKNE